MNPRDPRNRRNRPSPADGARRLEAAADELRAQVVRLPVDSEDDRPGATEWVVPRWLPDVPASAGPVAGGLSCPDCGARMLDGACLAGCMLPEPYARCPECDASTSHPGGLLHHDPACSCPPLVYTGITAAAEVEAPARTSDDEVWPTSSESEPARTGERLFGWASRHDDRSLRYAVRDRLRQRVPVQTLTRPLGPILDQGTHPPLSLRDASACGGFAGVAAANSLHGMALGTVEARELYTLAQKADHLAGEDYAGTSILAVMKAGQSLGYWSAYWWCFGTRDLAQAVLQIGPVLLGVAWSEQLNHPDPRGVVEPGGADLGGHAILCFGIRTDLPGGPHFGLQQSYGEQVGNAGVLWVPHRGLARMLAGRGEAAIPLTEQQLAAL